MKNYQFSGVIKYTVTGFLLGIVLIIIGLLLNYSHGFHGPWFHIFDHAPDFVIIAFSPIFLSLLFYLIGFRREQLEISTQQIKSTLSNEQKINSVADQQIKVLAKVVAQVNEAIIITDGNGNVEWVNDGFTKINGFTLEEVKDKELSTLIYGPLTDMGVVKRMVEKLIIGESVMEEMQTYHKKGYPIWLSVSIKPIFDDTGDIINYISIQNNISNRKGREISIEGLYKEVANYKFALDQSAIVIIFNIHGKIIHVNRKFCEISELGEEELLGNDYRSISISMRDKSIVKPIWITLQAGNTWKGELINRNKNGKTYWADTTVVPLVDTDGKPYQFLAIQQDITERKELEIELIANKNKLQQAMQIARLGSWELDTTGKFTISAELKQLYQFPLDSDISIDDVYNNIHTDDVETVKEKSILSRNSLQQVEVEYRYFIHGELHYMISNNFPRLDAEGNFIGAFGTVQDITVAKLSALALKKSEREKSVVLNNTQTILCLHDMNGIILDINNTAERMSGFSKSEIIGLSLKLIISPEYTTEFDDYIHTINNNDTACGTFEIYTKTGTKRVWLYQNAVYANEGNQPYVIASAVDITESVKAQNEVKRQQQFISNMSHELKTPLNAVIGFTDLLSETTLNKKQAEYVDIVKTASESLSAIINNILDASKIESDSHVIECQPIVKKSSMTV